jgi:hypothetical protein
MRYFTTRSCCAVLRCVTLRCVAPKQYSAVHAEDRSTMQAHVYDYTHTRLAMDWNGAAWRTGRSCRNRHAAWRVSVQPCIRGPCRQSVHASRTDGTHRTHTMMMMESVADTWRPLVMMTRRLQQHVVGIAVTQYVCGRCRVRTARESMGSASSACRVSHARSSTNCCLLSFLESAPAAAAYVQTRGGEIEQTQS